MFDWLKRKTNTVLPAEDVKQKASDQPWVTIIGESINPEKGIKIELDWNDAFVKYLKANGYNGSDEETVVGKWLVHLYKHLADKMTDSNRTYE